VGVIRRVSLTARIGALSITMRSKERRSLSDQNVRRTARRKEFQPGSASRRPPRQDGKADLQSLVRMFPVTANVFHRLSGFPRQESGRAAEATSGFTHETIHHSQARCLRQNYSWCSGSGKILCSVGRRKSPSMRKARDKPLLGPAQSEIIGTGETLSFVRHSAGEKRKPCDLLPVPESASAARKLRKRFGCRTFQEFSTTTR